MVLAERGTDMAEVVTIVRGLIQPDRVHEVADPYAEALKDGPPPDLEETSCSRGTGSCPS